MEDAARRLRRLGRNLTLLFRAVDRALGGERPPTRTQRYAARYPLRVGLMGAAIATGLFTLVALTSETHTEDFGVALLGGVMMGAVFGLTARGERARQQRLRRKGLWNGS